MVGTAGGPPNTPELPATRKGKMASKWVNPALATKAVHDGRTLQVRDEQVEVPDCRGNEFASDRVVTGNREVSISSSNELAATIDEGGKGLVEQLVEDRVKLGRNSREVVTPNSKHAIRWRTSIGQR